MPSPIGMSNLGGNWGASSSQLGMRGLQTPSFGGFSGSTSFDTAQSGAQSGQVPGIMGQSPSLLSPNTSFNTGSQSPLGQQSGLNGNNVDMGNMTNMLFAFNQLLTGVMNMVKTLLTQIMQQMQAKQQEQQQQQQQGGSESGSGGSEGSGGSCGGSGGSEGSSGSGGSGGSSGSESPSRSGQSGGGSGGGSEGSGGTGSASGGQVPEGNGNGPNGYQAIPKDQAPQPGDIIVWNSGGTGHTGIVSDVRQDGSGGYSVKTIEGNTTGGQSREHDWRSADELDGASSRGEFVGFLRVNDRNARAGALDWAKQHVGLSESQAEQAAGRQFADGLWCADFVSAAFDSSGGLPGGRTSATSELRSRFEAAA